MDQSSSRHSGRSSKRKTRKPNAELKEYALPTSPSLEQFKPHYEPSSNRPAYADSATPAHRTVTRARRPTGATSWTSAVAATPGQPTAQIGSPSVYPSTVQPVGRAGVRPATSSIPSFSNQPGSYQSSIPLHEPIVLQPSLYKQSSSTRGQNPGQANEADARFQAFLAKHSKETLEKKEEVVHRQTSPQGDYRFSLSQVLPTSASSFGLDTLNALDGLDPDFIAEFAKANQLELAEEISQELASGFRPGGAVSAVEHSTPTNPQSTFPANSASYLTPQVITSGRGEHVKPPRPPRSDKRLSISPISAVKPPLSTAPAQASQSINSLSSAFDDAVENGASSSLLDSLRPSYTSSRRSSISSTRPASAKHQQYSSTSLRSPPAHFDDLQITSPLLQADVEADLSQNRTATFEDIVPDLPDPSQDDFERDRRLSSLFKGLGIQGMGSAPPSPQQQEELRQQLYRALEADHDLESEHLRPAVDVGTSPDIGTDIPSAGRPSYDAESFASAKEGHDDDWGNGYPDSPENSAYQGPSASSSAYQTASDWCQGAGSDDMDQSPLPYLAVRASRSTRSLNRSTTSAKSNNTSRSRRQSDVFPIPAEIASTSVPPSPLLTQHESRLHPDPRISLGITDSVLASILASESFCLPSGVRLSVNEIAARLSVDKDALRMSVQQHLSANASPVPTTFCSSTNSSRVSSMQYFARPLSSGGSRTSWEPESPYAQYFDERNSSYMDAGYHQPTTSQEKIHSAQPEPAAQEDLPETSAEVNQHVPFIPARQESPLEEEADPAPILPSLPASPALVAPASESKRVRALSVSAFQKLSNSFSGASTRGKTRRRLPSFFGGNKNSTTTSEIASLTSSRAPSPAPGPQPTVAVPTVGRKRAMTGPACLIDIANAVTNSPSFSQMPPPPPLPPKLIGQTPLSGKTWRSTIPDAIYAEISKIHSSLELRRQEVIFELYQTEDSFVNGLKGVVRLFSQPLRTPQGRWIAGVPSSVSRLLDWLDDIVYLHSQLVTALYQCKASQGTVTLRVAEAFLPFIPRLEVHQPYLIRFEAVTREIDEMGNKPDSDFGEFVRMQQGLPECGFMSLSSFLLKPVQRLMKYPLFFKQLCDLTPAAHPDHAATISLFEATDSMIRVMQEVKVREEEYEEMKLFSTKISGLPTGMSLARRDRRLLANGMLKRVHLSDKDRAALEAPPSSAAMDRQVLSSVGMTRSGGVVSAARPRTANSTAGIPPRPMSTVSSIGSEALSVGTGYSPHGWPIDSPSGSLRANPADTYTRPESIRSFGGRSAVSSASQHHNPYFHSSASMSRQRQTSGSSSSRAFRIKAKETPLQAFVFNDLVVFATKQSEVLVRGALMKGSKNSLNRYGKEEKAGKYRVVDDWGVAKILSVTDLSGKTDYEHLLQVELLPVWTESESTLFTPAAASLAITIYLTTCDTRNAAISRDARLKERQYFSHAFEQSYIETMRSLVFLEDDEGNTNRTLSRKNSRANIGGTTTRRSKPSLPNDRTSCASFVDAGLPLPKSPSEQAVERAQMQSLGGRGVEIDEEREERGWWATRLKKVRKEMGAEEKQAKQRAATGYDDNLDNIRIAEMKKRVVVEAAKSGLTKKTPSASAVGMAISCGDEYDDQEDEETEDCAEYAEMVQASIQHARVAFRRHR